MLVAWVNRAWILVLAGILLAHAWLTLKRFDAEDPWSALTDDRPVLCGHHALHQYQGFRGAQALREAGEPNGYDPGFYAGYPKTILFDSGSRPAELFQWLAARVLDRGGETVFRPAAYKIGLAGSWCLLPLLFGLAALSAGLGRWPACFAAALAALVLNTAPGGATLVDGRLDLPLAAGFAALATGLLLRCHARPGPGGLLALAGTVAILVFIQPLAFAGMAPVLAAYYLGTAGKHRFGWHLALLAAAAIGPVVHWPWMQEAIEQWWILTDPSGGEPVERSFEQLLSSGWQQFWPPGESENPNRAWWLLAGGLLGCLVLLGLGRALVAGVLGTLLLVGLAVAAFVQTVCELPFLDGGAVCLSVMLISGLPLAGAVGRLAVIASSLCGSGLTRLVGLTVSCAGLGGLCALAHEEIGRLVKECLQERPPLVGFPTEVAETLHRLREHTSEAGRILWEEEPATEAWSPLLPIWTGRMYVGGLGAAARIEHASIRLANGRLAGRELKDWSDAELDDYCRTYNIGWIVCRSEAARARFGDWRSDAAPTELPTGHLLFDLPRPTSYVLVGKGAVEQVNHRGVILRDLQPVDGVVVLSFHYYARMVPSNDRVTVGRLKHGLSSVPLVRLSLPEPVSRLTLYWHD